MASKRIRIPNITPRDYQVGAFEYWDTLGSTPGRVPVAQCIARQLSHRIMSPGCHWWK